MPGSGVTLPEMFTSIVKLGFAGVVCASLAAACHSSPAAEQVAPSAPAAAAPAAPTAPAAVQPIPEVTVSDVQTFVSNKSATVFDANDGDTRQEYGVVPGAVLLSGKEYPLSALPAAKTDKLVFYCGGTQCRASDKAAERAASAGYSNVSVMRAGIRGWKAAGQATAPAPQS